MSGRFKSGHATWNKGIRFNPGGRSEETRFKKGSVPPNNRPIGSLRIDKDGFLLIKTVEDGCGFSWQRVARVTWKKHYGEYPAKGTVVRLIDDQNSSLESNQDINNIKVMSRKELMLLNSVHNYPKEIAKVVQLMGCINRQLNKGVAK